MKCTSDKCRFCTSGFKNLFGASGLFHCCKSYMKEYLKNNKKKSNFSLYIPKTLSKVANHIKSYSDKSLLVKVIL